MAKLRRADSQIMQLYYTAVWVVSMLGLVHWILQLGATNAGHAMLWNIMWLLNSFGTLALESSVVVFLFQGYLATGSRAVARTLSISTSVATVDMLVQAWLVFAAGLPLFLYGGTSSEDPSADMTWAKWSYWFVHAVLLVLVYSTLLILPKTAWRDLLPAKRTFYRYVQALLLLNCLSAVGAALLGSHVAQGYCLYGAASWAYFALYPPLLYITFLSEFFVGDYDLDTLYYAEMRDAGVFDDTDSF